MLESITEPLSNVNHSPVANVGLGGGVVYAGNAGDSVLSTCDKVFFSATPCWMESVWSVLPWSQLATMVGLAWIGYNIYKMATQNKE